jgi:hypothetical protein
MFDRLWISSPCASLLECLVVFATLFLAGSFWTVCIRWYVNFRVERTCHE